MDVNINAMFLLTQEVARRCMIPRRCGKILNISSTAGLGGNSIDSPLVGSYSASKGAVISLTRALATKTPLGRLVAEDDIKGAAAFFVSEAARRISDQFIVLDDGAFTTNYPTAITSDMAEA